MESDRRVCLTCALCLVPLKSRGRDRLKKVPRIWCVFLSSSKYSEAQVCYERDLAICERDLGPDHPDLATTLINLAGLLRLQVRDSSFAPNLRLRLRPSYKLF